MKFCPSCQTRYDEEILRFCTKDGTPLVEEDQPAFTETELPSESIEEIEEDDFGEETVIRRNAPPNVEATAPLIVEEVAEISSPRIVISTAEAEKVIQPTTPHVRARTETVYQVQPRKSNTGKIVLLTILGTFLILGTFGALFLMTRDDSDDNKNVNANFNSIDTNLNTNLAIGNSLVNLGGSSNINSNTNINSNFDVNINANTKTPTPTPTPKPSVSPSATSSPSLVNTNVNVSNSNATSTPTATPTPKPTLTPTLPPPPPSPKPSPSDTPPFNAGVLNGRAVSLPKPAYPTIAKQMRASGQVAVKIVVDESGNVTSAKATSGNSLLRVPAEAAARQSRISPIKMGDRAVRASGILVYNFVN